MYLFEYVRLVVDIKKWHQCVPKERQVHFDQLRLIVIHAGIDTGTRQIPPTIGSEERLMMVFAEYDNG